MSELSQRDKWILVFIAVAVIIAIAMTIMFSEMKHTQEHIEQGKDHNGMISFTTPHGLKVLYKYADEIPMVDFRLMLDGGGRFDKQKPGLARLTAAMLDQGTTSLDVDGFAEAVQDLGASIYQQPQMDYVALGLRSLSDKHQLEPAFNLLTEMLSSVNFPEKQLTLIRSQMLANLKYQEQNPSSQAVRAFYHQLYGNHPYGQPDEGTAESLAKITRDDVVTFFQQHYGIDHAVLAIVGKIDKQTASSMADNLALVLAKYSNEKLELAEPQIPEAAIIPIQLDAEQSHIFVGTLALKKGDEDFFPMLVGNYILGGGMLSRLFHEVREQKGLAYSISSDLMTMKTKGPFLISLQTRNEKKDEALRLVRDVLEKFIHEGPTGKEVTDAKQYLRGNFPLLIATNSAMINYLSVVGYYDLPMDYLTTFTDNVDKVTPEAIKAAFQHHINPEKLVVVTVGRY